MITLIPNKVCDFISLTSLSRCKLRLNQWCTNTSIIYSFFCLTSIIEIYYIS
nr:MAG TPA: hypothetical protein [Caudoviricetes sp.]